MLEELKSRKSFLLQKKHDKSLQSDEREEVLAEIATINRKLMKLEAGQTKTNTLNRPLLVHFSF